MTTKTYSPGSGAARVVPILLFACALLFTAVAPAHASVQEEEQGAKLLREIESGKLRCDQVGSDDFELIGEYAMGLMFASPDQHEAMNQMMVRMMGSAGESRVHEAMGRRFAGCGGGSGSYRGFGGMMGGGFYGGSGSMMGRFPAAAAGDDDFDGPSAAAMVGMMAVLIGAVAAALFWLSRGRGWGRHSAPLETLQRSFARGDLSVEEYEERRRLLGGGGR